MQKGKGSEEYGAHALMVCRLSLMIARAVNLSEEALQDLGVATMFHDMGYATREGADPKNGFEGFAPPFERHPAAGARLILKQKRISPSQNQPCFGNPRTSQRLR